MLNYHKTYVFLKHQSFFQTFSNCSCIESSSPDSKFGTARMGECDRDCKNFIFFIMLLALNIVVQFAKIVPDKTVPLRWDYMSMRLGNTSHCTKYSTPSLQLCYCWRCFWQEPENKEKMMELWNILTTARWDEEQKALERFSHLIMTECLRGNEVLGTMKNTNP